MSKARGSILVFLLVLWATLPALASLCPWQLPPCCRNMQEMCCISGNAPTASLCCPMQMRNTAIARVAVVNSADNPAQSVPLMIVAQLPLAKEAHAVRTVAQIATSPPVSPDRDFSILRI